jgi:hypothetical protein
MTISVWLTTLGAAYGFVLRFWGCHDLLKCLIE